MYKLTFLILTILVTSSGKSQVFVAKNAVVSFFSSTPVEDIEAKMNTAAGAINVATKKVAFKLNVKAFKFKSSLMQEHFNENYMESEKFPTAQFEGTISDDIDLSKEGSYTVNIIGKLTMHGVTQDRTISATIKVGKDKIEGSTKFKVKCVDHKIEVPKIVTKNIAESIEVSIQAEFLPKK